MTLLDLVTTAIERPLSLIESGDFYVVNFTRDRIHLQGDYDPKFIRTLPQHLLDSLRVCPDLGYIEMKVKTTIPIPINTLDQSLYDEEGDCYWLEVTLTGK